MATRARGIGKSVHSPEQAAFRQLMMETRKGAGLTQQQLAKRLKRPQSFVAKFEGGERRIDIIEFIKIVRSMDADPSTLFRALMRRIG
jgi:transcriptional regulator with XRE-family HTH domain